MRIGVVGDYDAESETHAATTLACQHSALSEGLEVEVAWVPTVDVANGTGRLHDFDGVWVAPGSPYQSLNGALEAIRFARERPLPLIGTCGGSQHVILEYARNVLGIHDARHAEYDPYASTLFVTPLTCSLAGQTMSVEIVADTTASRAYGTTSATERYYCNFGLNADHLPSLQRPRVRTTDNSEVMLPTWQAATSTELLSEHMVAAMLAGVSCRNYAHVALEPVGDVEASATEKSAVSARFVAATRERLGELRNRDLSPELRVPHVVEHDYHHVRRAVRSRRQRLPQRLGVRARPSDHTPEPRAAHSPRPCGAP